ncbi:MAG: hypothetical protein KJ556_22020 [Gammaproteobacteria bacterium]|nr:hypothetical protein [Gammaproteobacteria bacterium]
MIAVLLCVGLACAGEVSVDDKVAVQIEKELKTYRGMLDRHTVLLRQAEIEGKPDNIQIQKQSVKGLTKTIAEKEAALAKLRAPLTPEQETAKAEEEVKAAEEALAKAKDRLEKAKGKAKDKDKPRQVQ